jgi:hypothetical protein
VSESGPEKYRERGSGAPRKVGPCQEGKVIWADKSGRNEVWLTENSGSNALRLDFRGKSFQIFVKYSHNKTGAWLAMAFGNIFSVKITNPKL